MCPTSFSLRRKVYLFGGVVRQSDTPLEAFAECFDPKTQKWSSVKQPPDAAALIDNMEAFIASLGEKVGKVMVYAVGKLGLKLYFYDVVFDEWETLDPLPLRGIFYPYHIFGRQVINEDDGNLYWIDARKSHIYAMNGMTLKLWSGVIVGLERVAKFQHLTEIRMGVVLHHLWNEYFCLVWSAHVDILSDKPPLESHFTFLKVVKQHRKGELIAFALGCFVDTSYDNSFIYDAVRI